MTPEQRMKRWTLEEVERYAASQGVVFTTREQQKITEAQELELDRQRRINPNESTGWIDRWNEIYPRFLEALVNIGDVLMTIAQTFIVSVGVPVVLVLLLIVEHQRVQHGIDLFETDKSLASFGAFALVVLNLLLEFQVHYIEHLTGYSEERRKKWSLRLWWNNMSYRLGIGDSWHERELSPAARYRSLLTLVTFTILTLALAGSMKSEIEKQTGVWHKAILTIITDSKLEDMSTWLGGLLFAGATVLAAQGLSRYVAMRVVEIKRIEQTAREQPYALEIDHAGATIAMAIVNAKLAKMEPREEKRGFYDDGFFFKVPEYKNGNGSHS